MLGLTVSCIMSTGFGEEVSDCAPLQRARADKFSSWVVAHNVALQPVTQYSQCGSAFTASSTEAVSSVSLSAASVDTVHTLLPVSLSCHLASIHQRALILFIQTLVLYKSFTYLLTNWTNLRPSPSGQWPGRSHQYQWVTSHWVCSSCSNRFICRSVSQWGKMYSYTRAAAAWHQTCTPAALSRSLSESVIRYRCTYSNHGTSVYARNTRNFEIAWFEITN